MLGKLLKQDFRATARIMLPLYVAVPVLGLFTNLITRLCENQNGFLIRAISALVSFVFSLSLIAAVVTTIVLMVLRFYRNLMTDEGYLMFTLPVSTTELIFSKLIVSVVWFLGTFAVDALGLLLSGMLGSYEDIVRFRFAFTFGAPYSMPTITQAQAGWLTVGVVVLVVLCGLALCLMTYAAMAIGQSFKKNKGLMSVVFFFVLWIGTRIVLTLIFGTDYNGAGMEIVTAAVEQGTVAVPWAFLLKLIFTAITLAAGFKGGEVVPSFFVGATFGCAAAPLLGLPAGFGAAVGLAAVFCGVTNCPLASTLLAVELFGAEGMLYFALACCLSYMLSGYQGLYSSQTILYSKLKAQFINVHTNAYHAGEKTE